MGGRLFKGRLRLNPRNSRGAYVTPEGENPFKVEKGWREGEREGGRERWVEATVVDTAIHSLPPSLPPSPPPSFSQVDILIDGPKDRNRALEGDVVVVEVWPLSEWGIKRREQQPQQQQQQQKQVGLS